MAAETSATTLGGPEQALRDGDFERARSGFEAALAETDTAEAHDGLGRALWWLGDESGALDHRERAYVALRARGEAARAARIALWLSREYLESVGNEPASNGWAARATGLLRDALPGPEHGWLELTLADRALDPSEIRGRGEAALEIARRHDEVDLEASALAVVGRAAVLDGDLESGMTALDEAMTAATAGEVMDPLVFGDICCVVTRACEEAGELGRLMRWNEVVMSFLERHHHAPLIRWCGTCGAEVFLATGDIATAEQCLVETIGGLEATGHRSRCIQPNVKLAELRLLQGRVEEAERLLAGTDDLPESTRPLAALHLAKGEASVAAAILLRELNRIGDTVAAIPLLSLLIEVQVAQGSLDEAGATLHRLSAIVERSAHPRYVGLRELAAGRIARARGDGAARELLSSAVTTLTQVEARLEAARARFELAATVVDEAPEFAIREARAAVDAFETIGATREADAAAALVRDLGGPARTGPKLIGKLSKRELDVLHLLGEGLSNAEIAARLYISTKTAGNHVSNVLAKLGVRNRAEAAALAVRGGLQPVE